MGAPNKDPDRAGLFQPVPARCFEHFRRLVATVRYVKAKTRLTPELKALAAVQGGVLSRRQLLAQGIGRAALARMLADGILGCLTPGVYTLGCGAGWLGRAWAGILLGGDGAVLGFEAAGFLHGLIKTGPDDVLVFAPLAHADRLGWRFVRADRRGIGEPPRTDLETTVLDLCTDRDEDDIAALLADAISGRRTTAKKILASLRQRGRQRNRVLLRDILGDVAAGAHSALERRYLVNVERAHGLPIATRQAYAGRGHRTDAWYREYRLLAELDSKLHHSGGAALRDVARDNDHALEGLLTLRLGWDQVSGVAACQTALMVGQVLMSRGWEGPIQPCRRCRLSFRE